MKVQNASTKNDPTLKEIPLACADEKAAVEFMERKRWGETPSCPTCGCFNVYQMKDRKTGERQANFRWRCNDCRDQYTVRKGTVFEDSRIPMHHWCYGFWRACTSKKGVSALEIHRHTGVSYKSSLFMLNRIRYAMAGDAPEPLKGDVEVDETFVGGKPRYKGRYSKKPVVMAMVERGGKAKVKPIMSRNSFPMHEFIRAHIDKSSRLLTDEYGVYKHVGKEFEGGHHTTLHKAKEYVRGDVHSNTVEGFFATLKRGLNGIYHCVSREHLPKYLAEFEFRYNNRKLSDGDRILAALKSAEGKRLTYKQSIAV